MKVPKNRYEWYSMNNTSPTKTMEAEHNTAADEYMPEYGLSLTEFSLIRTEPYPPYIIWKILTGENSILEYLTQCLPKLHQWTHPKTNIKNSRLNNSS